MLTRVMGCVGEWWCVLESVGMCCGVVRRGGVRRIVLESSGVCCSVVGSGDVGVPWGLERSGGRW